MEKTIFQITTSDTIVFSSDDTDTIISFNSSELKWWFLVESGKFVLTDTLNVHNDLDRITVAQARKLALDWFEWEFKILVDDTNDIPVITCNEVKSSYNNVGATKTKSLYDKDFPLVEPLELDFDKKDAHTEHCCIVHRKCKFHSHKCTVVLGKKKPSHPCHCIT